MALIKCPECGHEVSNTAKTCPNCGYELLNETKSLKGNNDKKRTDRKLILGGIFALMIMLIVGVIMVGKIGGGHDKNSEPSEVPAESISSSNEWHTVSHYGVSFSIPGYYELTASNDGSIWYESEPAAIHLNYVRPGYQNNDLVNSVIDEMLSNVYDGVSLVGDPSIHEANNIRIVTRNYSGTMTKINEDVDLKISTLDCPDEEGFYIFRYIAYTNYPKEMEDYNKVLESIAFDDRSDIPDKQYQTIQFKNIELELLNDYTESEEKSDQITYTSKYGDVLIGFIGDSEDIGKLVNAGRLTELSDIYVSDKRWYNEWDAAKTNTRQLEINGGVGVTNYYKANKDGMDLYFTVTLLYNNTLKQLYVIGSEGISNNYYTNAYENSINSIRFVENQEVPSSSTGSSDIKRFLDKYEAFMDTYIEFMSSFQNENNSFEILGKYTELMTEYSEYLEKIDAIDTSKMSTEDYNYYMDVMTRVQNKLLKAIPNG